MGRPFKTLLNGPKVYACKGCRNHLADGSELISKQFHSKSGPAYLFATCYNTSTGTQEERMMTTGMHVVCDVFCDACRACVGWQYVCAYERSQKYKEGKVVLERACVVDFERTSPLPKAFAAYSTSPSAPGSIISSRAPSSDAGSPASGSYMLLGMGAACQTDYTTDEEE